MFVVVSLTEEGHEPHGFGFLCRQAQAQSVNFYRDSCNPRVSRFASTLCLRSAAACRRHSILAAPLLVVPIPLPCYTVDSTEVVQVPIPVEIRGFFTPLLLVSPSPPPEKSISLWLR